MKRLRSILLGLWSETEGQDLIEYSLLLAFFALTAVGILNGLKGSVTIIYSKAGSSLSSAAAAS